MQPLCVRRGHNDARRTWCGRDLIEGEQSFVGLDHSAFALMHGQGVPCTACINAAFPKPEEEIQPVSDAPKWLIKNK
jgi:hypothetical protein